MITKVIPTMIPSMLILQLPSLFLQSGSAKVYGSKIRNTSCSLMSLRPCSVDLAHMLSLLRGRTGGMPLIGKSQVSMLSF